MKMHGQWRARRQAFSLVELIVVISLITLLAAFTLVGWRALVVGGALHNASTQVVGGIHLARESAIVGRRRCALIMPGGIGADASSPAVRAGLLFRCWRLAYVDGDGNFTAWVENHDWEFLPRGMAIMEADGDLGIQDSAGYCRDPEENQADTVDDVDLTELGGGSTVSNVRALVFTPSGRLQGTGSRFVTVGEGAWEDGNWRLPELSQEGRNRSSLRQITIRVNKFTGGIAYIPPDQYE